MYKISFTYPAIQESSFGSADVSVPTNLRLEDQERVPGFDGYESIIIKILTDLPIAIAGAYLYERFFKPRTPTKDLPKAIYRERVFFIGSVDDVLRMIKEIRELINK